jgi:hypothetical protein
MSWFLVNLMIGLSDGAPFSGALGILLGWIYMVIPFGVFSAIFVGIQRFLKRIRRCESGRGDGIAPVTPPTPPGMRDCLAIARPTGSLSAGCLPAVGCLAIARPTGSLSAGCLPAVGCTGRFR